MSKPRPPSPPGGPAFPATLPDPAPEPVIGGGQAPDLLRPIGDKRYTPTRLLGTGGMGDVFDADDARLKRRVALKVPRAGLAPALASTLTREAGLASSLEHPSIVPVYDAGDEPGVGPYYAMRLLEQPTLANIIDRLATGDEVAAREFGLGRLLRYYIQICQAVHYAHTRGVVHCDLKPANITVGEFGEVIILDWGMAVRLDEGMRTRGGTPGFMAPEQLLSGGVVEPRSDIFALGAILYEILTLRPAYDDSILQALIRVAAGVAPFPTAPPPSQIRPGIPQELEQVCMKAMAVVPEARHASADALALEVESFIEGRKERERRTRRAVELLKEGTQLAEMYREYVDARPALVDDVAYIRAGAAPWERADRKRALWDAEDRLAATDAVGARTLQAAVSAFEQALEEQPGYPAARIGLADLYALEVERARLRRDEHNRIYFEELVKQYSDLSSEAPLAEGMLRVECRGGDAQVSLFEQEEQDRRLTAVRRRALGPSPVEIRVAPGSYVLRIARDGDSPEISFPVVVSLARISTIEVDLAAIDSLDDEERYVPAGVALLGGDQASPFGPELTAVDVPAFVVCARHVTFAAYLKFVETVLSDAELLRQHLPVNTLGVSSWRWDGGRFEPDSSFDLPRETLLSLPVFGISLASAAAYASWVAAQTGRPYRLLREQEWEKAARGVDGRIYPWGDYFDASFCKMYQSRAVASVPECPGAFVGDRSPYGVADTAGGISDWVIGVGSDGGAVDVARGGAWCDWAADCRLSTRRPYQAGARAVRVGFRLARTP